MKQFGLIDTFPGLVIMYTSALIPFTMLILGNFLSEIPVSMDEAAEIDGANMFQKLFLYHAAFNETCNCNHLNH